MLLSQHKHICLCLFAHIVSNLLLLGNGALVAAPPFKSHWYLGRSGYHIDQTSKRVKWVPRHPQVQHSAPDEINNAGCGWSAFLFELTPAAPLLLLEAYFLLPRDWNIFIFRGH
eukprot:1899471-Pyramimonas_sp.AAC.2